MAVLRQDIKIKTDASLFPLPTLYDESNYSIRLIVHIHTLVSRAALSALPLLVLLRCRVALARYTHGRVA